MKRFDRVAHCYDETRASPDATDDYVGGGRPVGEHRAGRRHEPPLRDLDDPHPREDLLHARVASTVAAREASAGSPGDAGPC